MSDEEPTNQVASLERVVRRALQYVYTLISRGMREHVAVSAEVTALIDLLIAKKIISPGELDGRRQAEKERLENVAAVAWDGPQLHVENEHVGDVDVDCDARKPTCKAACCRTYRVRLTEAEVLDGKVRWDLATPYMLPRLPNGDCVYLDGETFKCTIWEVRPAVCRGYSCESDALIWTDFAGVVPTDRVKAMSRLARERLRDKET